MQRTGDIDIMSIPVKELIGAIMFIVIIVMMIAWLFGQGFDCFGDEGCTQAKQELNRLVSDMNEVCERGALSGGEPAELGTYNFDGADYLTVGSTNNVAVGDLDIVDLPEEWTVGGVMQEMTENEVNKWRHEKQVESCDDVLICADLESCSLGEVRDALGTGGIWLGGEGEFTFAYWSPADEKNIHIDAEQGGTAQGEDTQGEDTQADDTSDDTQADGTSNEGTDSETTQSDDTQSGVT